MNAEPILRWPGAKRARAAQIVGYFDEPRRPVYCEPFLGGGSVFLAGMGGHYSTAILGDQTPRLIPTYLAIRKDPVLVSAALARLPQTVEQAGQQARILGWVAEKDDKRAGQYKDPWKAYFYRRRKELNEWVPTRGEVASPEHAAAFLWHRAGCFNGLVRVGPSGDNAPAGDRISLPSLRALTAFGMAMRQATLVRADFEVTIQAAMVFGPVDLFLDPPYSGDFAGYTARGFDDHDRDRLAMLVREVVADGGRVVVTESAHPEARRWLEMAGLHVREATGRTTISRDGAQRGDKAELIARSWDAKVAT